LAVLSAQVGKRIDTEALGQAPASINRLNTNAARTIPATPTYVTYDKGIGCRITPNHQTLRIAAGQERNWQGSNYFFRVAAKAMRYILVDYARSKNNQERGS